MASIGDVIRVIAKMSIGEDLIENVFHVQLAGSTPPDDVTLIGAVRTWLNECYTNISTPITDNLAFDTISIYNVTADEFIGDTTWPSLTVGGNASNQLPPQTAALINFTTGTLRSLGKKFLPPLTVTQVDPDGSLTAAMLTLMGAFAADVLAGMTGSGWSAVPGNYRSATAVFIPWLAAQVRDLFATQRRRMVGRGE